MARKEDPASKSRGQVGRRQSPFMLLAAGIGLAAIAATTFYTPLTRRSTQGDTAEQRKQGYHADQSTQGDTAVYRNDEQPYAQWYHLQRPVPGERFTHPLLPRQPLDQEDKKLIADHARKDGRHVTVTEGHKESAFTGIDGRVVEGLAARQRSLIEEVCDYAGLDAPAIEMAPLTPATRLEGRDDDVLRLYVVYEHAEMLTGRYDASDLEGTVKRKGPGGQCDSSGDIMFTREGFVLEGARNAPAIVEFGDDATMSCSSPLAETLHWLLRRTTLRNICAQTTADWRKAGSTLPCTVSPGQNIGAESQKEEAVVHATLDAFLRTNRGRLGLDEGELSRYMRRPQEAYARTPAAHAYLEKNGARALVQAYLTDPSLIFGK